MNISDLLVKIGFSSNKANVYLACLELGSASANEIAKKANIVRTTVYKILEELNSQGLIEEDAKSRSKIFKACPPQKIIDNLNQQKNLAESFLPDFINIFSETKFKPKLKFYDNQDGVKRAFEDILNYKDMTVMTFSPIKDVIANFGKTYSKHFTEKRVQQNILRQNLRPVTDQNFPKNEWELYASDPKLKREVKFLPSELTFNTLIQIYENKICVILSEKENFAFIVESEELSNFMKKIFALFWKKL